MNYLKMYESFNEIDDICSKYKITNYTINNDGSIDVVGDVSFYEKGLKKLLPLKFGKVSGYFDCGFNQLTSLEGCPIKVGGYFSCDVNELTSLEGCPKEVSEGFFCNDNRIESLKGCPIQINGDFDCDSNELISLEGCPSKVGGDFYCRKNQLTSFNGCPMNVGKTFWCSGNPVSVVYRLIDKIVYKDYYNLIEFVENWNPIREGNIIILDRLNDYLETFGEEPVTSVHGYKCI